MIERFKVWVEEIFSESKPTPVVHELEVAAAVLLIDVARADFHCSDLELNKVAQELQACFGFGVRESRTLVERAMDRYQVEASLYPFVKVLNAHCSAEDRSRLVEALWRVAYSDFRLDKHEEHQIRKISELLYVPHRDFIRTKHRAGDDIGRTR